MSDIDSHVLSSSDTGKAPKLLPDHLSTPEKRAAFEAQMLQSQKASTTETPQQSQKANLIDDSQIVYIVNNRSRSLHFKDAEDKEIIIDGQLSVTPTGPFLKISQKKLEELDQIHSLFNKKIKGTNMAVLEILGKEEYKKRRSDYLKRAMMLEKQWADKGSNSSHHADGSVDTQDRDWEDFKINYNLKR